MDNINHCKLLYEEYARLKIEIDTAFRVQNYSSGGTFEAHQAMPSLQQLERYSQIKKELVEECKGCLHLKPDQWFELTKN